VVNAGSLNWVFCKVYTNGGLVGLGEGSVTSKEATIAQAILEHERFLVGKDPTISSFSGQSMFRVPRWRGGPILNSAISAVEIALWDILGQALEVPIYKLLGGAARSRIRMYLDVGSAPEDFLRARELGYTAAKTTPLAPNNDLVKALHDGPRRRAQAASDPPGGGRRFDIAVDAHGRCTTPWRSTSAPASKSSTCFSSRSPPSSKTWASWRCCARRRRRILATGERSFTKYGFADLCARHLVDYVQPDVCHAGGIPRVEEDRPCWRRPTA